MQAAKRPLFNRFSMQPDGSAALFTKPFERKITLCAIKNPSFQIVCERIFSLLQKNPTDTTGPNRAFMG